MPHPNSSQSQTRTCIYAHEQCSVAFEQWTRMMDSVLKNYSKNPNKHRSGVCTPKPVVDPSLMRLLLGSVNKEPNDKGTDSPTDYDANGSTISSSNQLDGSWIKGNEETQSFSCRRGLTPWKNDDKNYSSGLQGLHEEIEDFYSYMAPLPEEHCMRQDVIDRLHQIVTSLWPSAEVKVFGSFETGLYLPTSDIDLVVNCNNLDPQTALRMLEQQLIEGGVYDDIKLIKTSVPIVKFTDRKTAVRVDVSFNVLTGLTSAEFIKEMITLYPELPYLVLVLKQFLLYRNLLESFNGGISSYCLILLIVSYLQLHPEDRQSGNHGERLIKFLELYGRHFNYLKTGIRICNGGSYFRKSDSDGDVGNRYSLLCVEDPFNPANDIGQGCYGAMKVREEFDKAFRELCDAVLPQYHHVQPVGSSILGRILLLPQEVVAYRQLMKERYSNFTRPHPSTIVLPLPLIHMNPEIGLQTSSTSPPMNLIPAMNEDRSDSDSISSQNSNPSSANKSSSNISSESSAVSETESEVLSDCIKHATYEPQNVVAPRENTSVNNMPPAIRPVVVGMNWPVVPTAPYTTTSIVTTHPGYYAHQRQNPVLPPPHDAQPYGASTGNRGMWNGGNRFHNSKPPRSTSSNSYNAGSTSNVSGRTYVQSGRFRDDRHRKNNNYRATYDSTQNQMGGPFTTR